MSHKVQPFRCIHCIDTIDRVVMFILRDWSREKPFKLRTSSDRSHENETQRVQVWQCFPALPTTYATMSSPNDKKRRHRSDYPFFLSYRTRWFAPPPPPPPCLTP